MGDFNIIIRDDECYGSPLLSPPRREYGFTGTISHCNLIDAGIKGIVFTWFRGGVHKWLDMVLVNLDWKIQFSRAETIHLPF